MGGFRRWEFSSSLKLHCVKSQDAGQLWELSGKGVHTILVGLEEMEALLEGG